jgi:hypothetical protein
MRKISAVLAVLAACAGPALAAKPPKPVPPNPNLTIQSSAPSIVFGQSVTISGQLKGGAAGTTMELQQNPYPYTRFRPAGKTAALNPDGTYAISGVVPDKHTQYKIVAKTKPASESGTVFVRVRLKVTFRVSDSTPKRGQRVTFSGTAAPEHDGKAVLIQKRTSTGYRTVARTILLDDGTKDSKYSKRLRIRSSGRFHVVVDSGDADHDDGTSSSRRLRVH